MTGSDWLDLALIAAAIVGALSGWRQGLVASALAFFGVAAGAACGVALAPQLLNHVADSRNRVLVAVGVIVVLVIVGELAGMILGRALRARIQGSAARQLDSAIGAGLQAIAVLLVGWMLSLPVAESNVATLKEAVTGSRIVTAVDSVAPSWLRALPTELNDVLASSGLREVIGPFGRAPLAEVGPPDGSILSGPLPQQLRGSVLRIEGEARDCSRRLEGTGFVVANQRVITNAHVVAGTGSTVVFTSDGALDATVVYFDPTADLAILNVPDLSAPVIDFAPEPAEPSQDALVLGYPGGGDYTATAARIRDIVNLTGPNIYRDREIRREVYTLRATVLQGNSGGPLLDLSGRALGVVFGAAEDHSDTGFALTRGQVGAALAQVGGSDPVGTGPCIAG